MARFLAFGCPAGDRGPEPCVASSFVLAAAGWNEGPIEGRELPGDVPRSALARKDTPRCPARRMAALFVLVAHEEPRSMARPLQDRARVARSPVLAASWSSAAPVQVGVDNSVRARRNCRSSRLGWRSGAGGRLVITPPRQPSPQSPEEQSYGDDGCRGVISQSRSVPRPCQRPTR